MTLTVRSASVTGATTKNAELTHAEMDANWAHVIQSSNQNFTPSGTGAVSTTVQTEIRNLGISVKQYGAVGDGVTDDTTAITNAIAAASSGQKVYFPAGIYICSGITIQKPVHLIGESYGDRSNSGSGVPASASIIRIKTGATSPLITISANTVLNYENRLYGVMLTDLCLDGNLRTVAQPAIKASSLDHFCFERLMILDFAAQAILFYTSVREGWINKVHTRFCGDIGSSLPCIDLRENSASDAHNMLKFTDCYFVYSLGNTIVSDSFGGSSTTPREIDFLNCFAHGVVTGVDGLPYTLTAAQKTLQHMVLGNVGRVGSFGCRWFVGGDTVATLEMQATATSAILQMVGGEIASHYASTGSYDGVKIAAGTLDIIGVYFQGNRQALTQTGGTVVERGNVYDNNPVLTSVRTETSYLDSTAESFKFNTLNGSGVAATRLTLGSGTDPEIRAKIPLSLTTAVGTAANHSAGAMGWDSTNHNVLVVDDSTGANIYRFLLASRGTQTTVGAAGGASALPATPTGYLKVGLGALGTMVIPYYAAA